MTIGFIIPEPNWDITFPNVDPDEWIDEDDE
jgi:hypothetical protein